MRPSIASEVDAFTGSGLPGTPARHRSRSGEAGGSVMGEQK